MGCWLVLLVGTIGWFYWLVQVLEVQLLDCKVDPTPGRSLAGFANSCNWAIHDLQFSKKLLWYHLFSQQVLGVVLGRPAPTIICTIRRFWDCFSNCWSSLKLQEGGSWILMLTSDPVMTWKGLLILQNRGTSITLWLGEFYDVLVLFSRQRPWLRWWYDEMCEDSNKLHQLGKVGGGGGGRGGGGGGGGGHCRFQLLTNWWKPPCSALRCTLIGQASTTNHYKAKLKHHFLNAKYCTPQWGQVLK